MLMLADHARPDKRETLHLRLLLPCFFEAKISEALSSLSWILIKHSYFRERGKGGKRCRRMVFELGRCCMAFSGSEGKGDKDEGYPTVQLSTPTTALVSLWLGVRLNKLS